MNSLLNRSFKSLFLELELIERRFSIPEQMRAQDAQVAAFVALGWRDEKRMKVRVYSPGMKFKSVLRWPV